MHKFGGNTVGTAYTGLSQHVAADAAIAWPIVADELRIKAGGNAADTAAGAGAREVTFEGLDINLNAISESVATAGASASAATTAQFFRLQRAWVSSCGTYSAANTAAMTIETQAGLTQSVISIEEGQTQRAAYTTPAGWYAMLSHFLLTPDSQKVTSFRVMHRQNAADVTVPYSSARIISEFTNLGSELEWNPTHGTVIPPETDLWVEAKVLAATGVATANIELILFPA